MCGSIADIQSATTIYRRGKKERYKKKPQGKNIMFASAKQGGHNNANIVRERRTMHNATMWHEITVII